MTVEEVESNTDTMVKSSPGQIKLLTTKGIRNETGNISFTEKKRYLHSLNFNGRNSDFVVRWPTGSNGTEFIYF